MLGLKQHRRRQKVFVAVFNKAIMLAVCDIGDAIEIDQSDVEYFCNVLLLVQVSLSIGALF